MNKLVFVLILFLLFPVVSAYTVGYVVKNPNTIGSNDASVKNELVSGGHVVTFLDDVSFNAFAYDLIVVSSDIPSVSNIFDNTKHRTLFLSGAAAQKAGLSSDFTSSVRRRSEIRNIVHYITSPYTLGDFNLYTSTGNINYLSGCKASGSYSLASHDSDSNRLVIFAVDSKSKLIDTSCTDRDKTISQSNVFFGLIEANKWSVESKDLFARSITWLMTSGLTDGDGDGYYSIASGGDDCNDADKEVHPGASDIRKNCVNDAPTIKSTSLGTIVNLLENTQKLFLIEEVDDDTALQYNWKGDGQTVGTGQMYEFRKDEGSYIVEVRVSDGSFSATHVWNVMVRDSSYFSCADVGGTICASNQFCDGSLYFVSDSTACCSTSCIAKPFSYDDVRETCAVKELGLEIDLDDFSRVTYHPGDTIDFDIQIKNRLDSKSDIILESYLYDLTKNQVVEKIKDSFDVGSDKTESSNFVLKLLYDLDETHQYKILVYGENDDELCNQKDVLVSMSRGSIYVIIDDFSLDKTSYVCGDVIQTSVHIKNVDSRDRDVSIGLTIPELSLNQQSELFDIEKKGENDDEKKTFLIQLPSDVKAGTYKLRATAYTNGQDFSSEKEIIVEQCA